MKIKKSQLTRELLESYAGKKVKIVFLITIYAKELWFSEWE